MKITVQNVIIDRDMVTKISKQLWPWEVAVLREKFGDGKVRVQGTAEVEREALPDAKREYRRLASVHGGDGGSSVTYVEMAYGRGTAGVKELQKALKASTKKKRKPAKKPEPVVAPGDDDSPLNMG